LASKLLGKSGNLRPILYYDSRGLLWQLYKTVYPEIQAIASTEGLSLQDKPRSYKVFFNRIIAKSRHRFYESVIPRRCNCCDLYERACERLPDVLRKLAVARAQDVLEDIVRFLNEKQTLEADQAAGEQHRKRDKHQRQWNVRKRASGIQTRELLVTIDFYSFLSFDSTMVHTLCFVLEWMEDGVRRCKYVDMPCLDAETNSSNNYFIATGWLKLLNDTDEIIVHNALRETIKYDLITICCDNAIVSKFHLATLLYLDKTYRLSFQVCPFCAHHGESVADGHAGHAKPPGKRLVTKDTTPVELHTMFTEAIGESPLKDTVVYPLPRVDNAYIDELIYSHFGGRGNIKTIDSLRTYGQLTTVRGKGDSMGYLTGRTLVDMNQQWPYEQAFPQGYRDEGRQIITLQKQDANFCKRCAWVHGYPVFHRFASAECLFRSAKKAKKRRKPNRAEAPVESDESGESDSEDSEGGEDGEDGGDGGGEEERKHEFDEFDGMSEADILPHFKEADGDVSGGDLVVVTGIEGEGDPYHVACVTETWPGRGRGGRTKPVKLAYYGHLPGLGYAPSWKKRGEQKERISLTKPKGGHEPFNVEVEAKDIILADVTLDSDRELSKAVRFTLTKWVSDMSEE
jgi:hypothetical protein